MPKQRIHLKGWDRSLRRGREARSSRPGHGALRPLHSHRPGCVHRSWITAGPKAALWRRIRAPVTCGKATLPGKGGGGTEVIVVGGLRLLAAGVRTPEIPSIWGAAAFFSSHPLSSALGSCPQISRIWVWERHLWDYIGRPSKLCPLFQIMYIFTPWTFNSCREPHGILEVEGRKRLDSYPQEISDLSGGEKDAIQPPLQTTTTTFTDMWSVLQDEKDARRASWRRQPE